MSNASSLHPKIPAKLCNTKITQFTNSKRSITSSHCTSLPLQWRSPLKLNFSVTSWPLEFHFTLTAEPVNCKRTQSTPSFNTGHTLEGYLQWWRQWLHQTQTGCCLYRWRMSDDSRFPLRCSCSSPQTGPGCRTTPPRTTACLANANKFWRSTRHGQYFSY